MCFFLGGDRYNSIPFFISATKKVDMVDKRNKNTKKQQ